MERISVSNLTIGTTAELEKRAVAKKMLKKNGKPNLSGYLRHLIEKASGVEQCKD